MGIAPRMTPMTLSLCLCSCSLGYALDTAILPRPGRFALSNPAIRLAGETVLVQDSDGEEWFVTKKGTSTSLEVVSVQDKLKRDTATSSNVLRLDEIALTSALVRLPDGRLVAGGRRDMEPSLPLPLRDEYAYIAVFTPDALATLGSSGSASLLTLGFKTEITQLVALPDGHLIVGTWSDFIFIFSPEQLQMGTPSEPMMQVEVCSKPHLAVLTSGSLVVGCEYHVYVFKAMSKQTITMNFTAPITALQGLEGGGLAVATGTAHIFIYKDITSNLGSMEPWLILNPTGRVACLLIVRGFLVAGTHNNTVEVFDLSENGTSHVYYSFQTRGKVSSLADLSEADHFVIAAGTETGYIDILEQRSLEPYPYLLASGSVFAIVALEGGCLATASHGVELFSISAAMFNEVSSVELRTSATNFVVLVLPLRGGSVAVATCCHPQVEIFKSDKLKQGGRASAHLKLGMGIATALFEMPDGQFVCGTSALKVYVFSPEVVNLGGEATTMFNITVTSVNQGASIVAISSLGTDYIVVGVTICFGASVAAYFSKLVTFKFNAENLQWQELAQINVGREIQHIAPLSNNKLGIADGLVQYVSNNIFIFGSDAIRLAEGQISIAPLLNILFEDALPVSFFESGDGCLTVGTSTGDLLIFPPDFIQSVPSQGTHRNTSSIAWKWFTGSGGSAVTSLVLVPLTRDAFLCGSSIFISDSCPAGTFSHGGFKASACKPCPTSWNSLPGSSACNFPGSARVAASVSGSLLLTFIASSLARVLRQSKRRWLNLVFGTLAIVYFLATIQRMVEGQYYLFLYVDTLFVLLAFRMINSVLVGPGLLLLIVLTFCEFLRVWLESEQLGVVTPLGFQTRSNAVMLVNLLCLIIVALAKLKNSFPITTATAEELETVIHDDSSSVAVPSDEANVQCSEATRSRCSCMHCLTGQVMLWLSLVLRFIVESQMGQLGFKLNNHLTSWKGKHLIAVCLSSFTSVQFLSQVIHMESTDARYSLTIGCILLGVLAIGINSFSYSAGTGIGSTFAKVFHIDRHFRLTITLKYILIWFKFILLQLPFTEPMKDSVPYPWVCLAKAGCPASCTENSHGQCLLAIVGNQSQCLCAGQTLSRKVTILNCVFSAIFLTSIPASLTTRELWNSQRYRSTVKLGRFTLIAHVTLLLAPLLIQLIALLESSLPGEKGIETRCVNSATVALLVFPALVISLQANELALCLMSWTRKRHYGTLYADSGVQSMRLVVCAVCLSAFVGLEVWHAPGPGCQIFRAGIQFALLSSVLAQFFICLNLCNCETERQDAGIGLATFHSFDIERDQ